MPQKKIFALLASDGSSCFEDLRAQLKSQGVEVWMAGSFGEVVRLLEQTHPDLVFTAASLTDGTWIEIVGVAQKMAVPTNVIVVGRHIDTRFYISAIERGAFDFIIPPFEVDQMSHVVRVAAENARRRREALALNAVA